MSTNILKFKGSLTNPPVGTNTVVIYTCPAGKVAKVKLSAGVPDKYNQSTYEISRSPLTGSIFTSVTASNKAKHGSDSVNLVIAGEYVFKSNAGLELITNLTLIDGKLIYCGNSTLTKSQYLENLYNSGGTTDNKAQEVSPEYILVSGETVEAIIQLYATTDLNNYLNWDFVVYEEDA